MSEADEWSRYWRSGQTHSCFAGGRPADTSELWAPFFDSLGPGSSVLDLACGAGALTRIAVETQRGLRVTGVDYAAGLPAVPGADIRAGVALEALPFADASFDAVVSQFGIEYADRTRAPAEAARVLRPGGALLFLVHAAEGEPIRSIRERMKRMAPLTSDDGLVSLLMTLAETAAQNGPAAGALAADAEARLREEAARPQDDATRWALGFIGEVLGKRSGFPPAYMQHNFSKLSGELEGYMARLNLMSRAALSKEEAQSVAQALSSLGIAMRPVEPATDGEGFQIGWSLGSQA